MRKSPIMAICDPKPSWGSYGKIQMERKEEGQGKREGVGRKRVTACCHATSQYANEHQNEEVVRDKVPLRSSCQSKRTHQRRGTKGQEVNVQVWVRARVCICLYQVQKKPQADRISSNHLPLPISIIKMVTIETAFLAPYPRLQGTRLKMVTNYTARLIIKNIQMVNWDAVGSSNFPTTSLQPGAVLNMPFLTNIRQLRSRFSSKWILHDGLQKYVSKWEQFKETRANCPMHIQL